VQPGETIGRDLWELMPDAIGSRFHQRLVRAMVTGRPKRLREAYAPARATFDVIAYPSHDGLTVLLHRAGSDRRISASELAAGVAHYFDSYLSTIQEATDQLLLRLDIGDPLRNTASVIAHGTQLCSEVTRRLQAVTRQRVFLPQPADMNALLRNFRRRVGPTLGTDIRVVLKLGKALPIVALDADQFEEALYEIVLNARDAIRDTGTVVISTRKIRRLLTRNAPPHTFVGIDITDDGVGMAAETLRFAPLPFFTTKDRTVVPGLGLSMAIGIINQAGGKVRLQSEVDSGTTVRILLPAAV
jgi:signal transduction histidine kinase